MTPDESAAFAQMLLGMRMQIDGMLRLLSKDAQEPVEKTPKRPRFLGDEDEASNG